MITSIPIMSISASHTPHIPRSGLNGVFYVATAEIHGPRLGSSSSGCGGPEGRLPSLKKNGECKWIANGQGRLQVTIVYQA
jgi:hypothetical protein